MNPELSEGIQILSALLLAVSALLGVAGAWAERKRDVRYNDYGINKDARLG